MKSKPRSIDIDECSCQVVLQNTRIWQLSRRCHGRSMTPPPSSKKYCWSWWVQIHHSWIPTICIPTHVVIRPGQIGMDCDRVFPFLCPYAMQCSLYSLFSVRKLHFTQSKPLLILKVCSLERMYGNSIQYNQIVQMSKKIMGLCDGFKYDGVIQTGVHTSTKQPVDW